MKLLEFPKNRIPSLDGLRAISIALVLWAHMGGTKGFVGTSITHAAGNLGNLGVRVFFVISGYLITTLLLAEDKKTGTISLGRFYLRRCFRIFPPAYAFLAVVIVLNWMQIWILQPGDLASAATYTANYHLNHSWYVGHLWSLSVEEQFYLLWPAVLLLAGRRRGIGVTVAVYLAGPFVRVGLWYFFPSIRAGLDYRFEAVADTLACGCALALLNDRISNSSRYLRCIVSRWVGATLAAAILGLAYMNTYTRLAKPIGQSLLNLAIALWISHCMRAPDTLFGRFLNWRPITIMGVLSYSVYLWQQPFLNRSGEQFINGFPQNIVFVAGCAVASYILVERPFLMLRQKLEESIFPRQKCAVMSGAERPVSETA